MILLYFRIELTCGELQVLAIWKSLIQPAWMEKRSHSAVLCHCVHHNEHGERKKRELSEEVRHKIVTKHGQSQGYKPISRDLDVPLSTVRNIHNVIRKFKAHDTVANLPGRSRKRKLDWRLQRRIVRMVGKTPRSTAKQIQADLQTQGSTVSTRTIRHQLDERGFLW